MAHQNGEKTLAHLKSGDKVKIVFDAYPGEVFTGQISSIGWEAAVMVALHKMPGMA